LEEEEKKSVRAHKLRGDSEDFDPIVGTIGQRRNR
jgi:hypothetical protein